MLKECNNMYNFYATFWHKRMPHSLILSLSVCTGGAEIQHCSVFSKHAAIFLKRTASSRHEAPAAIQRSRAALQDSALRYGTKQEFCGENFRGLRPSQCTACDGREKQHEWLYIFECLLLYLMLYHYNYLHAYCTRGHLLWNLVQECTHCHVCKGLNIERVLEHSF